MQLKQEKGKMKNDTEELINPDFKIQDSDMSTKNSYTHGTQTYELKYYDSSEVTIYNAAEKHTHKERRKYFQTFFNKK